MRHLILLVVGMILISSCKKDESTNDIDVVSQRPEVPMNDSLDFNADQIYDFVISYQELSTYDAPSSEGSIIGSISPLNQNHFLYKNGADFLFLEYEDMFKKESDLNTTWEEFSADLISIGRDYENWDNNWSVIPEQTDFNYLAFKIKLNDSDMIGWISLGFDTETGKISIKDEDISDSDSLIIYKYITN